MAQVLNISGLFRDEKELIDTVRKRKICYDSEPYYINRKGGLLQVGFQLNLYGTFTGTRPDVTTEDPEYPEVERDIRRLADALANTCNPLHMCGASIIDTATITYSPERKMRPDVTVHLPVFDQRDFGRPLDSTVRETLQMAVKLLESAGVRKTHWHDPQD